MLTRLSRYLNVWIKCHTTDLFEAVPRSWFSLLPVIKSLSVLSSPFVCADSVIFSSA